MWNLGKKVRLGLGEQEFRLVSLGLPLVWVVRSLWTVTRWSVCWRIWFIRYVLYLYPSDFKPFCGVATSLRYRILLLPSEAQISRHHNPAPRMSTCILISTWNSKSLTLIGQNLMKGYIARERGIVVLSKGGAFPGTGVWAHDPDRPATKSATNVYHS